MVSLISMIGSSTIKNAFPVASQKNIHIVSYSISARFPMSGGLIDKLTNEQIQKKHLKRIQISRCLPSRGAPTCRCRCRCEPPTTSQAYPPTGWESHHLERPPGWETAKSIGFPILVYIIIWISYGLNMGKYWKYHQFNIVILSSHIIFPYTIGHQYNFPYQYVFSQINGQ